jgi:PIN domain nuclease of toxin-antitoxin system
MKVLIDTHIFLWFFEATKLSLNIKEFLEDTFTNEIYVSYVVGWEISIKYGIGKLQIPEIPELFVPDRIRRAGFLPLPIDFQHVLRVHNLPPIHRDPFDRLLVSQAQSENMTIFTADRNIPKYDAKVLEFEKFTNSLD